jgi:glycosyltransferase involved in cell wall biosynthesis
MVCNKRPVSAEQVVLETRVVRGSGGGPDKTILNSPRHLWSAGYRTVCAYMHPPGDPGFEQLRRKAEAVRVPLLSVPDRGPWDWRVVRRYLAICRHERVRIWHGHDYKSNALGLVLRRLWPVRLVTTVHGWVQHTRRTPLYYAVDRLCLPRYEAVLCVSEDLREQALSSGVPADRCLLVENAIDTEDYSRRCDTTAAKRREGFTPGRLVVGAVGRLSAEKGFDVLIRAAHRLVRAGHDLEVVIAGEGDARPQLEALAAELGLGERVRMLGYRADPRGLYEALDLFVLSSLREGLPNVVLEAMAMEVPVLATRVAGVPRLIHDGANGLLAEPDSVDALAGGMARLLGDADARTRLASAGRRTVVERYSFTARMQKVRAVYDRLLGRNVCDRPPRAARRASTLAC